MLDSSFDEHDNFVHLYIIYLSVAKVGIKLVYNLV